MNTLPEGLGAYTELAALSALRAGAGRGDPQSLGEVASQFESLFLHMLLKSMRAATPESALFGGPGMRMYNDLFDLQVSQALAENRSLGIARLLVEQLGATVAESRPPASSAGPEPASSAPGGRPERPAPTTGTAGTAGRATQFSSPEQFVDALHPHAVRAGTTIGVPPTVLLAQAALETGWGRFVIRHADGRSSHNLFGVKAGRGWDGPRVRVSTLESVDGLLERVGAEFRSYANPAASFDDYVDLVTSNPRYRIALQRAPQPAGYLHGLQSAGYATDPRYAKKILEIMGLPIFSRLKAPHLPPL